jgi:luciferase-type oxidoreductase
MSSTDQTAFPEINRGYNNVFRPNKLSVGLVVAIENYNNSPVPSMENHIERVQLAEALGFASIWLRDVPFNVPSFGDAGQTYDPFVYLGFLAAHTKRISLATGSIVLPLRHPAHVAKAAATADVLSGGRLILGIASGDRPEEYPALNMSFDDRGKRFRDSFEYIKRMWETAPTFENDYGTPYGGMDMLPKPMSGRLPLMITGGSQQSPDWLASNGDGWVTYPRNVQAQQRLISSWRSRAKELDAPFKPVSQSLYIDLVEDDDATPQPIHLGFRSGVNYLRDYLSSLEKIGVNHVAINLRFNQANIEATLERLSDKILPDFPSSGFQS